MEILSSNGRYESKQSSERENFSSSISLAADRRPARPSSPPYPHRTALPPVRSPIRSRCARVNPPLGELRRNKISVARRPRGRRPLARPPPPASRLGGSPPGGPPPPATHRLRHRAPRRDIAARHVPASCLVSESFPLRGAKGTRNPGPYQGHYTEIALRNGLRVPGERLREICKAATPVPSRTATPATSASSSRAQSPVKSKGKRKAISSSSGEDSAGSDCTVVGSDEESESATNTWDSGSAGRSSRSRTNSDASFSSFKGRTKGSPLRLLRPQLPFPACSGQAATSAQMVTDGAPSRSDCTRLHINYSKAVRVADDGIKMICPNVETFRSLNKYLVDNKVQFHTYALEEERKIKAVIRGIPADFALDDIQNDLCGQFSCALGAQNDQTRRQSALMVLAILPRTDDAKKIFNSLRVVCGLSGIRVEAPFKKGGPGQCHRCQKYGHAAANCHADPRCVKCLVPHWTKECPLTRESQEKPSCVNCGQQHTANYRGCPKAPKFMPRGRPNYKRPPRPRRPPPGSGKLPGTRV
ncbi:Nucleic-acid-binding protein from transposon X-element [Eumeta japonica]|uniref:Nucleic-acid-binding protein from transposon X-element n=1 Tax=Eumeta variegata TaxID=151549 RepID=A0A4C1ZTQ9_EUMVA|nr:Nucleic-acid-binding protein from transposon X-element [Eumeta japonica]